MKVRSLRSPFIELLSLLLIIRRMIRNRLQAGRSGQVIYLLCSISKCRCFLRNYCAIYTKRFRLLQASKLLYSFQVKTLQALPVSDHLEVLVSGIKRRDVNANLKLMFWTATS